jgi:hypothetical protein
MTEFVFCFLFKTRVINCVCNLEISLSYTESEFGVNMFAEFLIAITMNSALLSDMYSAE